MKHPIAILLRAVAPAPYGWAAVSALLLCAERILTVTVAVRLVLHTRNDAFLAMGALAAIFSLRAAVRGTLRARARKLIHTAAIDALLTGDVVKGSPLDEEDAQSAVHEGTHRSVQLLSETLPGACGDGVAALLLGAYVVMSQPARVGLVGGAALLVAALSVLAARRLTRDTIDRAWRAYAPVVEDLVAALGARLELVANGQAANFREDAEKRAAEYHRVAARSERFSAAAGRAPMLAAALSVGAVLLFDRSVRGSSGTASLADIAIFATMVPAFLGLARAAADIGRDTAGLRPLARLLDAPRRAEGGSTPPPGLPAPIAWSDVGYAYPRVGDAHGPPVLHHLSISWHPGHILLLAGPNGSGKSTCVRLLLGLARPHQGQITVGGVDLFTLDLAAFRTRVAYLPQRPFLPERATVRDAMRLLARDASDGALRAALERIDVWRTLGARSESPLDVRVGTLSAGQRQRVAVARVLAMDAPLLILDEPDANLDAAGIRLVATILRDLAATRMVAVIAHTDQLIALGDTLVTLEVAA